MRKQQAGHDPRRSAALARLSRQMVAALEDHLRSDRPPEVPAAGVWLWRVFSEIADLRRWREGRADPISWSEALPWLEASGVFVAPHHLPILRAMDRAFVAWAALPEDRRKLRELTAAEFDTLF